MTQRILINARAAARLELGGVERWAREMTRRLPALRPDTYLVERPRPRLVHRMGHIWEQVALPVRAKQERASVIFNPANLAPLSVTNNVVVIHDVSALKNGDWYSPSYRLVQRLLLPAIARRALHVVTVSEFSKQELLECLPITEDDISVVYGGVGEEFSPEATDAEVLERYNLKAPYLLAVGSRTARKNHQMVEQVAQHFEPQGISVVTVGGTRPQFLDQSGEGRSALVSLGAVPEVDLPAIYAGAAVFLMPSLYEGFGLPCIEAMASGVPVVASNSTALPEVCGDVALYTDPNDLAEFSAQIDQLLKDLDLQRTMIEKGLARAAMYSWDQSAKEIDVILEARTA